MSQSIGGAHEKTCRFVTALEEGMLADGGAIKKLNDNPDLVEEFYQFYAAEKGDLAKFLNSRWYDFLPDGLKLDITNTPALKTAFENASPEVREGMVEAWKTIKYCDDPTMAANATYLTELENVAAHREEINGAGGYKAWKTTKGADPFKVITTDVSTALSNRISHIRKIILESKKKRYIQIFRLPFKMCH